MQFDINKIGDLRRKLNLTQKEIAKLAGVSQSLIAKIESQNIDPAYSKVVAIFNALENELNKKEKTIKASEIMTRNLITVGVNHKLDSIIRIMKENAISQLPVMKDSKPVGSVSDDEFIEWIEKYGNGISKISVKEVIKESFPIIPKSADMEVVTEMLKFYKALLVKGNDGEIIGIVTKSDLIKAMKS